MATKKKSQPDVAQESQASEQTAVETSSGAPNSEVEVAAAIASVDAKVAKESSKAVVEDVGLAVGQDEVMYVSRGHEFQPFEVLCNGRFIKSVWNRDRTRLIWRVPKKDVERFDKYYMVREGRIVKV